MDSFYVFRSMFYEMNVIFAVRPAEKWTALIGKPCRTPLEMMESVVEEEEEERPDITGAPSYLKLIEPLVNVNALLPPLKNIKKRIHNKIEVMVI
tara:strand:+ start:1128 stop:1412 length:285 start_codon:yes stop_codon:yes gene_type:complete